jgi:hypothetical protein
LRRSSVGPVGSELPLLPKKQAFRYDVLCFVTRGKYDFDTMDGFLSGDEAWRARAVRAAARFVVVKTPGSRPWLFLFDVGGKDALAPLGMRVQFTSTPQKEISIDALVADQLYVLQGPRKELERYATDVQLRTIIGKAGDIIALEGKPSRSADEGGRPPPIPIPDGPGERLARSAKSSSSFSRNRSRRRLSSSS